MIVVNTILDLDVETVIIIAAVFIAVIAIVTLFQWRMMVVTQMRFANPGLVTTNICKVFVVIIIISGMFNSSCDVSIGIAVI